ncbi:MAG: hypothetical protein QOE90_1227 [Thermoplasmata archaeon]|jgi:hypothetical protein|nr:hypothetical protein [Thermoplasmata archaeon]
MTMIDKVQGTIEKLTGDDTRLNSAEITTIQQAYNALQLGLVKTALYQGQAQNADVKACLGELRDDFLVPHLDKPRRILEKSGIPFLDLHATDRVQNLPKATGGVLLRDEEIMLDTVLALQATITGLQAGAIAAVRGDVRDYFLNARDAATDQWRKVGLVAYRLMPQAIPPTMSGVSPR